MPIAMLAFCGVIAWIAGINAYNGYNGYMRGYVRANLRDQTPKQARPRLAFSTGDSQSVLNRRHNIPVPGSSAEQAEPLAANAVADMNERRAETGIAVRMSAVYMPFRDWDGFDRAGDAGGANRRAALSAENLIRLRDGW